VIAIFEKSKMRKTKKPQIAKSANGTIGERKIRNRAISGILARGRAAEFPKIRFFNRHFDKGRKRRFFFVGKKAAASTDLTLFGQGFSGYRPPR
jgi:hypothetical protein